MVKKFFRMKIVAAVFIVVFWCSFSLMNMVSSLGGINDFYFSKGTILVNSSTEKLVPLKEYVEKNVFEYDKFRYVYIAAEKVMLLRDNHKLKILKESPGYFYAE